MASHRPPSRVRIFLFKALLILFCLVAIEGIAAVGLRSMEGRWVSRAGFLENLVESRGAAAESEPAVSEGNRTGRKLNRHSDPDRQWLVHPFIGYVRNHEAREHLFNGRRVETPVNEHGFFGPSPVTEVEDAVLTVLLTGGSVALDLYFQAGDTLIEEIGRLPIADGKRVELLCTALGGMKQPQQLMALNYFLTLGAHYDVVINLDGFNEVVLTLRENFERGVYPFFPRNWAFYSATGFDPETAVASGRLAELQLRLRDRPARLASSVQRHSYFGLLVWNLRQRSLQREAYELDLELRETLEHRGLGPQQRGPAYESKSWEEIYEEVLGVWIHSSLHVKLEGNIGCLVNGAGLAMSTMDLVKLHGGEPANFLDVGGGADADQVTEAFRIILADRNVRAVLVNIFGGIMQCDTIVTALLEAYEKVGFNVPLVVRLEGTNVDVARKMLAESGRDILTATDLTDAAQKVVATLGA